MGHKRTRNSLKRHYLAPVVRLGLSGVLKPGEVARVAVLHDDWCALLRGTGPCDCEPSLRLDRDTARQN